ncbi:MAG: hypothetical protein EOO40_04105, partial [Deltaproteobacteria bacterium]
MAEVPDPLAALQVLGSEVRGVGGSAAEAQPESQAPQLTLSSSLHRIAWAEAQAFARATGVCATDPRCVPPMAVVRLTLPHGVAEVMQRVCGDVDRARLQRAVHFEEALTWHGPIPADTGLRLTPKLQRTANLCAGELFYVHTGVSTAAGLPLAEAQSTVLIRERRPGPYQARRRTLPLGQASLEAQIDVTDNQAEIYAAASGDDNPIHLDDAWARQAGLQGK